MHYTVFTDRLDPGIGWSAASLSGGVLTIYQGLISLCYFCSYCFNCCEISCKRFDFQTNQTSQAEFLLSY